MKPPISYRHRRPPPTNSPPDPCQSPNEIVPILGASPPPGYSTKCRPTFSRRYVSCIVVSCADLLVSDGRDVTSTSLR